MDNQREAAIPKREREQWAAMSEEERRASWYKTLAEAFDYQPWAVALCTLLDKIELLTLNNEYTDDMAEVGDLCRQRHDIARDHGLLVVYDGTVGSARVDH